MHIDYYPIAFAFYAWSHNHGSSPRRDIGTTIPFPAPPKSTVKLIQSSFYLLMPLLILRQKPHGLLHPSPRLIPHGKQLPILILVSLRSLLSKDRNVRPSRAYRVFLDFRARLE